jgi:hypothetical protein
MKNFKIQKTQTGRLTAETGSMMEGTTTGRISANNPARSNTPKADRDTGVYVFMDMFVNEDGTPRRTKATHPYSYDPEIQYVTKLTPTGSCYSDRLQLWYPSEVLRAKMLEHFGESGDYYSGRSAAKIQAFLRDLMDKPSLVLTRIEEHCNQATGYPVWFFAYK